MVKVSHCQFVELQRVDHRDQQDRDAEHGGDDEPVA